MCGKEDEILQQAELAPHHHSRIQITQPLLPCPDQPPPSTAHGVTILTDSTLMGMIVIMHHLSYTYTMGHPHPREGVTSEDGSTLTPCYYKIPVTLQEGYNTIWWDERDNICHYTSASHTRPKHPFLIIFPGLEVHHQQLDGSGHYVPCTTQMSFPLYAMRHVPPAFTWVRALPTPPTLKQLALIATGYNISKHQPLTRGRIGQERAHNMLRFTMRAMNALTSRVWWY